MLSSDLRAGFTSFLATRGLTLETLGAAEALRAVTDCYLEQRLDDVDLDADGDMLLVEWGTHDWSRIGPTFQYGLTRQTITDGGEDEDMWQLRLVLHFAPTDETEALGSGDHWCPSPDDVPDLLAFFEPLPCTAYARAHAPVRVELVHDPC